MTPEEKLAESEKELNYQVSFKCMGWRVGTPMDWYRAKGLEIPAEPDDLDLRPVWLDAEHNLMVDVNDWSPECGPSWYPATHLEHAWKAAKYMEVQGVQFDIGTQEVSCRVHKNSMHASGRGQCPAEALSKALIALKEA